MTLLAFITALSNKEANITVVDAETDSVMIEFKAQGIANVESDLSAKNVRRWSITGASAIKVVIETT